MRGEFVFPETVGREVCRYAGAIWSITPEWTTLAYMRDYRDRFIERYGTACAVPLGELADPHRGLGLPPEYGAEPTYARTGPGDEVDGPRRAFVGELIQEAVLSGGDLVLTDEVVRRLADVARHDPEAAPPRGLELCFQVLADSTAALDRGDFRLLGSPHIGAWAAGATAGRFAEAAGLTADLSRLAAETSGDPDGEVIAAQVELLPVNRAGSTSSRCPGCCRTASPSVCPTTGTTPLSGLAHPARRRRFGRAAAAAPGERAPCPAGAPAHAGPGHAGPAGGAVPDGSGDGTAAGVVGLGLGRARHAAVSAARAVRPGGRDAEAVAAGRRLRDAARAKGAEVWEEDLDAWRRRLAVPDRLHIARNDQMYPVDLRDRWDRELLRSN